MLLIHTALHAEAKVLIDHFKLRRQHQESAFAYFSNETVWLVESGTGKSNAATAVGWLSAKTSANNPIWLNIGLAGHASHNLGELRLAHRIEDQAKGHRWYPPMITEHSLASDNLLTIDQATSDYPNNTMIDMEASGFFTAATRFSSLELIHSMKVISDNRQHPPVRMKIKKIEALFDSNMEAIANYAEQLLTLRDNVTDSSEEEFAALIEQYHPSTYQQHELRRLLQRYRALTAGQLSSPAASKHASIKELIQWLNHEIQRAPVTY